MIITNQHHRDLDPLLYGDLSLGLFLQTLSCHPSSWGTGSIIMAASCFTYQWRKIQTDWFKQIVLWQTLRGSDYLLPPPVFGRGRCLHARAQTHKHTHTHTHTRRQSWILTSRLNLLVPALFWRIQKKEDKPQTPRHLEDWCILSSLTVLLCILTESDSLHERVYSFQ